MGVTRKVTMELPDDLLRSAQEATGEGITETVRRGLRLVAAGKAYRELRKLRGKVRFSVDIAALRRDRR
jgi:hypothetical protein